MRSLCSGLDKALDHKDTAEEVVVIHPKEVRSQPRGLRSGGKVPWPPEQSTAQRFMDEILGAGEERASAA